jgi:hypothetical protein
MEGKTPAPWSALLRRNPKRTAKAPEVMISELEAHHRRLERIGASDLWARFFAGLGNGLFGAGVGLAIAHDKLTYEWTVVCFGFALLSGLAFAAVRDTEAESIKAIRDDYKRDVLDSFEYVELRHPDDDPP